MRTLTDQSSDDYYVNLHREGLSDFYGIISIGDSKQKFNVLFDTSCGLLWVPSARCTGYEHCKSHRRYDRSYSSSYQLHVMHKQIISVRFSGKEVKGNVSVDDINLSRSPAKRQTFLEADWFDGDFSLGAADGVFGLSFVNEIVDSTLEGLMKTVPNQVFYFKLKFDGNFFNQGVLKLGKVARSEDIGQVIYQRTCVDCGWGVETNLVTATRLGSKLKICEDCKIYPNPATRFIWVPSASFEKLIQRIGARKAPEGENYIAERCNPDLLPDITFQLNGPEIKLEARFYARFNRYSEQCTLLLKERHDQKWILGSSFFEAYYVLFDYEGKRIGFAPWVES